MSVEVECTRCHRRFHTTTEGTNVCPDCLQSEFGCAGSMPVVDIHRLREEYSVPDRRQAARAIRMRKRLSSSGLFSMMGKVRCAFAILLFLICAFAYMLGDSETYKTPINQLEPFYQRMVSLGVCLVAACLLFPSYKRHKFIVGLTMLGMLVMGWCMPAIWHFRKAPLSLPEKGGEQQPVSLKEEAGPEASVPSRQLTEQDLQVFKEACASGATCYAIYLNTQDARAREIIRDALTRLLRAENTRSYTRANGVLFVVANAQGQRGNISRIVSRLGKVTNANVASGIYEVQYDAVKANMVSAFPSEVLGTPTHPSFVSGNISELSSLEPMRVRAAATRLKEANARVLRPDIREALLLALKDSWAFELETYTTLVEALVVYSPVGDREMVGEGMKYFQYCCQMRCATSETVMQMLVKEKPAEMVNPIVELWKRNPLAWNGMLAELGNLAEPPVLQVLADTDDHQQINSCLKFLENYGSAAAIPAIEPMLQHPDSLIARSARITLDSIRNRTH